MDSDTSREQDSTTQATPGPWDCTPYGNIGYEVGASESIAIVNRVGLKRLEWLKSQPPLTADGRPWPGRTEEIADLEASGAKAMANARLIAAAPDLLAALRALKVAHAHSDSDDCGCDGDCDDAIALWCDVDRLATAAIAKAEGRMS